MNQDKASPLVKGTSLLLHYMIQGESELILFLHGFPEFWYSWRHQIPEFARDYKVVALDLRGYNESDRPQARPIALRNSSTSF